ncbi:MAG TPA: hypothetical protein ENI87_12535 [bacterium]|nr:hypothetical protein [bacterium]
MLTRKACFLVAALLPVLVTPATAQGPARAVAREAIVDGFSTESGGFLLAIPGVADDFVLFADGQWHSDGNGTATLTAWVHQESAFDRAFFLELLFQQPVSPGDPNYPPAGAPIATLQPAAYAPTGPVDPSTFVYYAQVSGTMTGLRAFDGARIDVSNATPAQLGVGANNKNVGNGLLLDLTLTVQQPPLAASFTPSGPLQLRADLLPSLPHCATHVDGDPAFLGGTPVRIGLDLPGVASDYLFLPSATWVEADDGTASLNGTLRSQSDHRDAWQIDLQFTGRIDPGDPSHPPAGSPVQLLLPGSYAAQGGPVDPDHWRYYTAVTGALTGRDDNSGGLVQVSQANPFQLGVGAQNGNLYFGMSGDLAVTVAQQPTGRTIAPTGGAELRATLATSCVLPPPQVATGDNQTVDNVTNSVLTFTGQDLGFVEQAAIGNTIVGLDERQWLDGFVRIVDHGTLELSIPQGIPAGSYPLAFLNPTRISNPLTLHVQEPTTPTMATEPDRLVGEPQHWITHGGSVAPPMLALVVLSTSNQPSTAPGIVSLQIGNQFAETLLFGFALQDPLSNLSVVTLPQVPAAFGGGTIHSQVVLFDGTQFPLQPTNAASTTY